MPSQSHQNILPSSNIRVTPKISQVYSSSYGNNFRYSMPENSSSTIFCPRFMDLLLYISDTADFVQNVYRPYIYLFFSTIHDFLIDVISFGCLYSIVCPEKNPVFLCYLTISQFILFRQFFTDVTPTYMISKIFPCQTFEPSMHCTKPRNIFQTYNRHNAIKHYKCRSAFNISTEDAFNP